MRQLSVETAADGLLTGTREPMAAAEVTRRISQRSDIAALSREPPIWRDGSQSSQCHCCYTNGRKRLARSQS